MAGRGHGLAARHARPGLGLRKGCVVDLLAAGIPPASLGDRSAETGVTPMNILVLPIALAGKSP
jgi:hypothetical protein